MTAFSAPDERENVRVIAEELMAAQNLCKQVEPMTGRLSGFNNTVAYDVQRLIHEARVQEGMRPVGRKIGFSNRDLWREFDVHEPVWAHVYDTTVVNLPGSRGTFRLGHLLEPRIEPEIVLHFCATPPQGDDLAAILGCIDWIAHGFEIVQSRFRGWKFRAADAIADVALHAALLVGEPMNVERFTADLPSQLERFSVALMCNGEVRDRGRGSNVLGNPLAAVAHLITALAKRPEAQPLQKGELVTTGSLTGALAIQPGETWTTALEGIALPGLSVALEA